MRRIWIVLALLLAVAVQPQARRACAGASPSWTSTADRTSLAACIAGATAGDTITVTGNATWTSGIEFTRGVNLIGSGNPTITGKVRFLWWNYSTAAQAAHDTLKIQGFIFDGDDSASSEVGSTGLVTLGYSNGGEYVTAVILDNTFKNTDARGIYVWGRVHGVAARNTFDRVYIPLGLYGDNHLGWAVDTQAYGDGNQFYFEDNLIQYSTSWAGSTRAVSGGNGGQGVIRYNDWNMDTDAATGSELWELHGLQPMYKSDGTTQCAASDAVDCDITVKKADSYSVLSSEWYGNDVYGVPTGNEWMQHRGGWMLFHHNYYAATTGTTYGIRYKEYACDITQQYYATYGPFVMHVANTYTWNNFDKTTRTVLTKSSDLCADNVPGGGPYVITEDVDYWNDKYATFNGTTGVGCGTAAAFAKITTCTTGTAYWVTNQSCTSLSGMIGRSPATPISGTLYKCTATDTWTSYYTPYTYPHPLAGSASAPSAPTNVRIR